MLLLENKLSTAIKHLLKTETRLQIAVAFIGDGANQLIGPQAKDVQIICNLTMEGTNPNEVRKLIGKFGKDCVKQIDNLHAKLYIGTKYAIVGSANMSASGLGTQPTALREAGYRFKLDQPSGKRGASWFNALWEEACNITDKDLKNAEDKWNHRDRTRNGDWKANSGNICDYDFDRPDFPLLDWIGSSEWDVADSPLVKNSSLGGWDTLHEAADNGVDIECDNDIPHLIKDRWILKFYRRRNARLFWLQLSGTILANVIEYKDKGDDNLRSVAVSKYGSVSGPFKIDKKFADEFRKLLFGSGKYSELINDNFEGCWFDPRIELMRQFWKELQSILCKEMQRAVFTEE